MIPKVYKLRNLLEDLIVSIGMSALTTAIILQVYNLIFKPKTMRVYYLSFIFLIVGVIVSLIILQLRKRRDKKDAELLAKG